MAHSDDEGLIIPPAAAPTVVAIVPIFKTDDERKIVSDFAEKVIAALAGAEEVSAAANRPSPDGIKNYFFDKSTSQKIVVDWRDARPGDKQYHWEQRGVPLRIEIGPRDVAAGTVVLKRRLDREKLSVPIGEMSASWLRQKMDQIQAAMFQKAKDYRDQNTREANSFDEMKKILTEQGGFVRAWFKPDRAIEAKIKEQTKATVRCIISEDPAQTGKCIYTGEPTSMQVLFAQSY
jgi:prolyl-tRNA synthetase